MMNLRRVISLTGAMLMVLIFMSIVSGFAATNTVPRSALNRDTRAVGLNDLKPPQCANVIVTQLVLDGAGGNFNGLFLGTPGDDSVNAGPSNDCIVGGDGQDRLAGNQGDDVLLGGPGNDQLNGGPGTDYCYGGGGNDTYISCEFTGP